MGCEGAVVDAEEEDVGGAEVELAGVDVPGVGVGVGWA